MRFSEEFIERVRESTNIVDVISQATELKRSGHNLVGLCPFPNHREKTPSFSVSDQKQAFFCFGCKKGGNVFTFLREYQGLSFPEAIEVLAQKSGIPIPVSEEKAEARKTLVQEKERFFKVNRLATEFFEHNLNVLQPSHSIREYLKQRGLTDETLFTFRIGLAPDKWDGFSEFCQSRKIPSFYPEKLGLIKRRQGEGTGHYDLFRNRIMFPIFSATGEVLGFGGRIIADGQPKYLNSPESPLFSKGKVFYGLNESLKHIRAEDSVIVVEGYMDFLGLFQAGIRNVAATLGTALTPDHARLIKRQTSNVFVLFDGDAAGQAASEKSLPVLLAEGLFPRHVLLPGGLDPDEYAQKFGAEELRNRLRDAPDLFLSVLQGFMKDYKGLPSERVALIDRVAPIFQAMVDLRLKDLYLKEVSERLNVEVAWLVRALQESGQKKGPMIPNSALGKSRPESKVVPTFTNRAPKPPPKEELWLLNLALSSRTLFELVVDSKVADFLNDIRVKRILERALVVNRQAPSKFDSLIAFLSSEVEDPSLITQFLGDKGSTNLFVNDEEKARAIVLDCIKRVQERHLKLEAQRRLTELKVQKTPENLEQFLNTVKDRHSLKKSEP